MSWKLFDRIPRAYSRWLYRASIPVWMIAIVAVSGFIYQISDRQNERVRNAEELHKLYIEMASKEQVFDQNEVKKIVMLERCKLWREKNSSDEKLDCLALTEDQSGQISGANFNTQERKELRKRLDEALKDVRLNETVVRDRLILFDQIRQCGESGSCDEDTVRNLFIRDMTIFLNNVCVYVKPGRALEDLKKETEAVANFLLGGDVFWWTEDEKRESQFFCSYLRELDKD